MNRQIMRVAAGVNLVAGCLLLQGCGMFGKKTEAPVTTQLPPGEETVVTNQPNTDSLLPVTPVEPAPPVELPTIQNTTPYTIQKGDTLSAVAYKYNLRWQDVVAVNPGISPKRLRIGQVIQLPGHVDVTSVRHMPVAKSKVTAPKVSAPKTKAAPVSSGPMTMYVVKSGDSLSLIAHKHGIKTAELRAANGLKSDRIIVGQKLKVPGAKKVSSASAKKHTASASAPKTTAPKAEAPKAKAKAVEAAKPAETVAPPPAAATPTPAVSATTAPATPVAPVAAAPAAAESSTQTYTVKEGEDLYAVAIRWGVSPSDLKALNNLTSTELKAGTVLKIPGGAQ